MADHGGEVYGGGSAVQPIQETSEVPKVDVDSVGITVSISCATEPGVRHRTDRASVLAHDLQRDPLTDAALRVRVDQEREVGMGVDIDEPGRQGHSGQVDLLGPGCQDPSHFGDTITRDRDIDLHPGSARPVEHRRAAQDEVRICPGADPPAGAASGEADSHSPDRPSRTDQTTGPYEGTTFQNEPLKTSPSRKVSPRPRLTGRSAPAALPHSRRAHRGHQRAPARP